MIHAALDWLRDVRRRRTWNAAHALGRRGEDLAHRYLRKHGYIIVARNYRLESGGGEADVLARDGEALVVVEVKTRRSGAYGPPDRAIGEEKFRKMMRVAREYARRTDIAWERVRFDVVTVVLEGAKIGDPEIVLIRGAWTPALQGI